MNESGVAPMNPHPAPAPALPDENYVIRCVDCVAGMAELEDASVDLVVTSPPYNLGIRYRSYDDQRSNAEYLDWTVQWARQVRRILKPDGSFFLNVAGVPANPNLPFDIVLGMREMFCLQNTIHWIKAVTIRTRKGDEISAGHFKPIQSKRFLNDCHEYVFHFTPTGKVPIDRLAIGVVYADKSNIARWSHTKGKDRRCRGNTWFVPYQTIKSRSRDRPHPATFPVELAENCIRLHGNPPGLTVLDPFLGIGAAAIAAKRCGVRRFVGFDIDPGYVREALDRLKGDPQASLNIDGDPTDDPRAG